jgi:formamidopyrimidine-DNA glycosylase
VYATSQEDPIAHKLLGKLGVEPLEGDFDALQFHAMLRRRKTSIKQVLLAGELVVGVGNIYASEALFRSGIRPTVRSDRLSRKRVGRLQIAICEVLSEAIEKGGSTLRDFSNAQGEAGHFQNDAMVYGRQGQPCKVCQTPIRQITQGQRSTFFCPACQKP